MISRNRRLVDLVEKVFNQSPIDFTDSRPYLESFPFERRRSISPEDVLSESVVTDIDFHHLDQLRSVYPSRYSLGSIESNALEDVLATNETLIIFRSGTGSGKSTLVRRIDQYYKEICRQNSILRDTIGLSFFSYADYEKIAEKNHLDINVDITSSNRSEKLNSLCLVIGDQLLEFVAKISRVSSKGENESDILNKTSERIVEYQRGAEEYESISMLVDILSYTIQSYALEIQKNGPVRPKLFVSLLQEACENPYEFLEICVQLVCVKCNYLNSIIESKGGKKSKFIYVFDNADSINPELFSVFVYLRDKITIHAELQRNFSLVAFTRLSTSWFNVIATKGIDKMKAHRAPLPADVVLHSVLNFLLDPNQYEHYQYLNVDEKKQIIGRFLHLCVKLLDKKSDFYETINALSGTNVRNGYSQARKWVIDHSNLNNFPDFSKVNFNPVKINLYRSAKKQFIVQLCQQVLHGIFCTLENGGSIDVGVIRRHIELVVESSGILSSKNYIGKVQTLILERMVASLGKGGRNIDRIISIDSMKELFDLEIEKRLYSLDTVGYFSSDSYNMINYNEIEIQLVSKSIEHPVVDYLSKWAVRVLSTIKKDNRKKSNIKRTKPSEVTILRTVQTLEPIRLRKISGLNIQSRYRALTALYSKDEKYPTEPFDAYNLFVNDAGKSTLLKLYYLYYLNQLKSNDGVSHFDIRRYILSDLNTQVSEIDVDRVWLSMVHKHRRLAVISIADELNGLRGLENNVHESIYPSWAGKAYFCYFLGSNYYINWCFRYLVDLIESKDAQVTLGDPDEESDYVNNFYRYHKYVLHVFRVLYQRELPTLEKISEELDASPRLSECSVIGDVFFRTISSYCAVIRAYQIDPHMKSELLKSWLDLAEYIHNTTQDVFTARNMPVFWQEEISYLKKDFARYIS